MRRQRHRFWESYPDRVAEESLLRAQLVQALLQAEHRQDRLHRNETAPLTLRSPARSSTQS
jgi:hypothetical protein